MYKRQALGRPRNFEFLTTVGDVDKHPVTIADLTGQEFLGQRIADGLLDEATQWTSTISWVITAFCQPRLGTIANAQVQATAGKTLSQLLNLDVNNAAQLLLRYCLLYTSRCV